MRKLTDFDLALKEDDERLLLEGRQILRRVMNEARSELERLHLEAQKRGEIIRVTGSTEELEILVLAAAKKELKKKKKELNVAVSK